MKIKTLNNINQIAGGIIGYSVLFIFIFGGFYVKTGSIVTLIVGLSALAGIIFLSLKQIKTVIFYSDKLTISRLFKSQETIDLKSNQIKLLLMGGTFRIPSNSISLWNNNKKIANFRLNSTEWEFEEFYHCTREIGYTWKISDDQQIARKKDFQLFLERKKIMDLNREENKNNKST